MMPTMESNNPWARAKAAGAATRRGLDELRSAVGTLASATISKGDLTIKDGGGVVVEDGGSIRINDGGDVITVDDATGAAMQLHNGQFRFWQDYNNRPEAFGLIYVDTTGGSTNYLRIFPPHDSGSGLENSLTIQGRTETSDGHMWLYSDGQIQSSAGQYNYMSATEAVQLSAPRLELYGIPSVGSATYQLGYNLSGGNWSVCLVTSSRRYKQDIETAAIDPDAVLNIRPVMFRDIAAVEADGDDAPVNFGVIAEELHDLGLGPLLVSYKDGEPDAAKYDRIGLALIPVVKRQAEQIADLTARLEALEAR